MSDNDVNLEHYDETCPVCGAKSEECFWDWDGPANNPDVRTNHRCENGHKWVEHYRLDRVTIEDR